MAKELQKHNYCYENYTSVTSKPDSSLWNTTIKDFTPDLDSVIDIIEQGVIDENRFVPIDYLVWVYPYDRKDRHRRSFLETKLTEKYGNQLLFVTVEQNKAVRIISRAILESQPV